MSGRGDNNKHGSAGRGASNQSNQPFVTDGKTEAASNHQQQPAGGHASQEQPKMKDPDAHRDTGNARKRTDAFRTDTRTFNMMVDDLPYIVTAESFTFNGELRFYISVNGGTEHVFTWDSEVGALRAIDDDAAELPDALEAAISEKLQSHTSR